MFNIELRCGTAQHLQIFFTLTTMFAFVKINSPILYNVCTMIAKKVDDWHRNNLVSILYSVFEIIYKSAY